MDHLDLDLDRLRRCGFPEVVFALGKTVPETVAAAEGLVQAHGQVLVTRAEEPVLEGLAVALPQGRAHPRSGCFTVGEQDPQTPPVAVVSAGTSDQAVAEEAILTLRMRRVAVRSFADCGCTGLHRVLRHIDAIRECCAVIVVAGMDAALATVLTGLVDLPVVGCPTSIGYGVADGGRTALRSMLTSCAPGLMVVNIDNGFGAGYAAAGIARRAMPPAPA